MLPAHGLGKASADGQAEPGAPVAPGSGGVDLGERREEGGLPRRLDPDAGVGHRERHAVGIGLHVDQDVAGMGEFHRVRHQVGEDLADPARIPDAPDRRPGIQADEQFDRTAGDPAAEQLQRVMDQPVEIERDPLQVEPTGLDLGEIEDVVEDGEQRLGGPVDGPGGVILRRGEPHAQEQLGHPQDPVHRGADLVAHVGQEFGLRPVRPLGPFPRLLQGELGQFPLVDVLERAVDPGGPAIAELDPADRAHPADRAGGGDQLQLQVPWPALPHRGIHCRLDRVAARSFAVECDAVLEQRLVAVGNFVDLPGDPRPVQRPGRQVDLPAADPGHRIGLVEQVVGAAQVGLHAVLGRHIHMAADHAQRPALGIPVDDLTGADHPYGAAIPVAVADHVVKRFPSPARHVALEGADRDRQVLGEDQALPALRPVLQFVVGVAEHRLEPGAQVFHPADQIPIPQAGGRGFDHRREHRPLPAQVLFDALGGAVVAGIGRFEKTHPDPRIPGAAGKPQPGDPFPARFGPDPDRGGVRATGFDAAPGGPVIAELIPGKGVRTDDPAIAGIDQDERRRRMFEAHGRQFAGPM
jgi:hypothetical protein